MMPQAAPSSSELLDYRITSFIVDDMNHDQYPDLALGIDVFSYQEGLNYTVILKVNHDGKFNFTNHTLLDPECGSHCRFLLLDHAPF
jgi:hypothetical protein